MLRGSGALTAETIPEISLNYCVFPHYLRFFGTRNEKKIAARCNFETKSKYNLLTDNILCDMEEKIKKILVKEISNEKKCIFAS